MEIKWQLGTYKYILHWFSKCLSKYYISCGVFMQNQIIVAALGRESCSDPLGYEARPGFLNLGTVDVLGLIILHCVGLFCAL